MTLHDHLGHAAAVGVRLEAHGLRVREQRDVLVLDRRPHAHHLGVRLGVHDAGEAVAVVAAHAAAERHVVLAQQHAARGMEGMQSRCGKVVRELLDARLVRDRRERVGRAGGWLGGVLAPRSMNLVELLGLRVVRLHLVI